MCVLIVGIVGTSGGTLGPVLLSLLVHRLGLTDAQSALVVSLEAAGFGVGTIVYAIVGRRFEPRSIVWAALIGILASNLVSPACPDVSTMGLARFLSGAFAGLLGGTTASLIAGMREPQRVYSLSAAALLAYSTLLVTTSSFVSTRFGLLGFFGLVALITLLVAAVVPGLPTRASSQTTPRPSAVSPRAVVTLGGIALIYAAHNALWSFQARFGDALGLDQDMISWLLGGSVLGGVVGALGAAIVGVRKGLWRPQLTAFAALFMSSGLLIYGQSVATYAIAATMLKVAWFFSLPYLQASIARQNAIVGGPALAIACMTTGAVLGPVSAGAVVGKGMAYVGLVGAILYGISAVLLLPAMRSLDRETVRA